MELVFATKKQAGASVVKAGTETNVFLVSFFIFLIIEKSSNVTFYFWIKKASTPFWFYVFHRLRQCNKQSHPHFHISLVKLKDV